MLAPNKQNLLSLQKQKKTFQNGHKLLTEKRNGLIATFLDLSRKGKILANSVSANVDVLLNKYYSSTLLTSANNLIKVIEKVPSTNISVHKKRLSGVRINEITAIISPQENKQLKLDIAISLFDVGVFFPSLIELIQMKTSVKKISDEILKTNRQISNIERKINHYNEDIKWMKNTLQEKENLEKSILIKIFE